MEELERTEVEEDGGGGDLLNGEGSLSLEGADLLLGLLRWCDCSEDLLAWGFDARAHGS